MTEDEIATEIASQLLAVTQSMSVTWIVNSVSNLVQLFFMGCILWFYVTDTSGRMPHYKRSDEAPDDD